MPCFFWQHGPCVVLLCCVPRLELAAEVESYHVLTVWFETEGGKAVGRALAFGIRCRPRQTRRPPVCTSQGREGGVLTIGQRGSLFRASPFAFVYEAYFSFL